MEQQVKGRGYILASIADYPVLDDIKSLDAWRAALQLPAAYDIEEIRPTDPPSDVVLISVRHEQIPVVEGDDFIPYVWLVYQHDEAGNRLLLQHVEVQQYSAVDGWHTVAVTNAQK